MWISCQSDVDNLSHSNTFFLNLDAGLSTMDPAYARDQASWWMTSQVYSGLVELDDQLRVKPLLAKRWDISPDGKTYTFHLRRGVYFHTHPAFGPDSTRTLTARDVVYSFTRICDPQTASTGQWIFNDKILGLEAFREGSQSTVLGFSALDDSTLVIRLTRPFPPFLGLLAMPYGFVVPREVVESLGDDFSTQPIGTGPFRFFRWENGDFLTLHRNAVYFETEGGQGLPYLDAVHVRFIPSRLSAFIDFTQGRLDMLNALDDAYKDELLTPNGEVRPAYAHTYQVQTAPQLNTEYLGMMVDPIFAAGHPLAQRPLRKALNYAIDRKKLVRYLLNGMGYPAEAGFIPQGMPGFDPEQVRGYTYQPDSARLLLAEAGFPLGEGLPELTLYSTQKYANISEFIQKSWENIGVKVQVQNLQGGALRKEIYQSQIHLWRASWIADYPDGENYLSLFYSQNFSPDGPNTTHFADTAFDALYRETLQTDRDSLRFALYRRMDQLMLTHAPVIPLYYDRSLRLLQPYIQGMKNNPMNLLVLKYTRKQMPPGHTNP